MTDIRPDYANIEKNGKLEKVDPDEVAVGSIIIVQPGEKVPIDGIVIEGSSTLNTAALTGESVPRDTKAGEEIISGCINMTGVLKIKTTKEFDESTVSKILDLVENASSRKSKSEDFISKFAKIYTPAVCYVALAESASSHPISKSLQKAYGKEIDRSRVSDIQEISGNGVIAKVDGVEVAAGNDKLMNYLNIQYIPCHSVGTIIHMAIDGKYAGHIVISDIIKPHSKEAIQSLKATGVQKTVMLTGDAKKGCREGCR